MVDKVVLIIVDMEKVARVKSNVPFLVYFIVFACIYRFETKSDDRIFSNIKKLIFMTSEIQIILILENHFPIPRNRIFGIKIMIFLYQ